MTKKGKKVSHQFDSQLTLTVLNKSDRSFEGWITVDVPDRQQDKVDPLGFTAEEYMTIIGGMIQGTHSNVPIGRWNKIEIREKEPGKLAWYGWGKIFKGIPELSLESYPIWDDYWSYMVSCYERGQAVGLSIGGDPDYKGNAPYVECDDSSCYRVIPKTWWYETSVLMNRHGPSVPANWESYVEKVNTLAKSHEGDHGLWGELRKAADLVVERHPTEDQIEAGNYKKGHIHFHDLHITIENPKGSIRSGTDRNGKKWSVKMPCHYGYIKRTKGADGEHLYVFVGPESDSEKVFVVWQLDDKGKFDEHKVLLGFDTEESAFQTYAKAYNDPDWPYTRVGDFQEFTMADFQDWMKEEGLKKKAPSVTQNPHAQGMVGRLAGDVGHIHPPSGMDREDPMDDERRYPAAKILPETNPKRLGEVFPGRRKTRHGVGRGARGTRHSFGPEAVKDPTEPPKNAAMPGWHTEHPSGVTIIIHEGATVDGDALYDAVGDVPTPELEKMMVVEVHHHGGSDYIRVIPRDSTLLKQNAHVHVQILEGMVTGALAKRHGDYSPTNSEIADRTGLMLHGQREYPEEGENFVGSKAGLNTSPVKKMDETVLSRALRKALDSPAELRKDHDAYAGYEADPDKEIGKAERDPDATSAHQPYEIIETPKWRPGTKIQANPHRPISPTVGGLKKGCGGGPGAEMMKNAAGVANDSSIDPSATPDGFANMKKGDPPGMAEKPGYQETNTPEASLQKAERKPPEKKESDDENVKGQMGPQEGKGKGTSGSGDAPEDEEGPHEGFPKEGEGQMPQAMDAQPQQDPTGLETHPQHQAPGQDGSQTTMPLPGAKPLMGNSIGEMLLREMTPEELDGIAMLVLSLKKDGAAGGSPLTTDTLGAYHARMGPKPQKR